MELVREGGYSGDFVGGNGGSKEGRFAEDSGGRWEDKTALSKSATRRVMKR